MASKIASKNVQPTTALGKAIRMDEEDKDEHDGKVTKHVGKDQVKIKNAVKQSKEEEKIAQGGGDVFARAIES